MREVSSGLLAASQRTWAARPMATVIPKSRSALLLGSNSHVLCEAIPLSLSFQAPFAMTRSIPFVDPRIAMPTLLAA